MGFLDNLLMAYFQRQSGITLCPGNVLQLKSKFVQWYTIKCMSEENSNVINLSKIRSLTAPTFYNWEDFIHPAWQFDNINSNLSRQMFEFN